MEKDYRISLLVTCYESTTPAAKFIKLKQQYEYLLTLYECSDAYFYYRRQKIYISNITDEISSFKERKDFLRFGSYHLLLFLVIQRPDNVYIFDYNSENFKDKPCVILPLNWFSSNAIYNEDSASTRGADNQLYNLCTLGTEPVSTSYINLNPIILSGGIAISYRDPDNNKIINKLKNDNVYYPSTKFDILYPYNIIGLQIIHNPNMKFVTFKYLDNIISYEQTFALNKSGVSVIKFPVMCISQARKDGDGCYSLLSFDEPLVYFIQGLEKVVCGNNMISFNEPSIKEEFTLSKLYEDNYGSSHGYFDGRSIIHNIKSKTIILDLNKYKKYKSMIIEDDNVVSIKVFYLDNTNSKMKIFKKAEIINLRKGYANRLLISIHFEKPKEIVIKMIKNNNQIYDLLLSGYPAIQDLNLTISVNKKICTSLNNVFYADPPSFYYNTLFNFLPSDNMTTNEYYLELNTTRDNYDTELQTLYDATIANNPIGHAYQVDDKIYDNKLVMFRESFDIKAYLNIEAQIYTSIIYKNIEWFPIDGVLFESNIFTFPVDYFKRFRYCSFVPYPTEFCSVVYANLVNNYRDEIPICFIANKNVGTSIKYRLDANSQFKFYSNGAKINLIMLQLHE